MIDELFPDIPIEPRKVAVSETVGGTCTHCGRGLRRGRIVVKLAPACCITHHRPHQPGSANGPGSWVCTRCERLLVAKEKDG